MRVRVKVIVEWVKDDAEGENGLEKKTEKFSNSNLMESLGKTSRKISSLLKMSPF